MGKSKYFTWDATDQYIAEVLGMPSVDEGGDDENSFAMFAGLAPGEVLRSRTIQAAEVLHGVLLHNPIVRDAFEADVRPFPRRMANFELLGGDGDFRQTHALCHIVNSLSYITSTRRYGGGATFDFVAVPYAFRQFQAGRKYGHLHCR